MGRELSLTLHVPGGDDEELSRIARQCAAFLHANSVGFEVLRGPGAVPPGEPATVEILGTVMVALGSKSALETLIQCVQSFFASRRRPGKVSITSKEGRTITLESGELSVERLAVLVD